MSFQCMRGQNHVHYYQKVSASPIKIVLITLRAHHKHITSEWLLLLCKDRPSDVITHSRRSLKVDEFWANQGALATPSEKSSHLCPYKGRSWQRCQRETGAAAHGHTFTPEFFLLHLVFFFLLIYITGIISVSHHPAKSMDTRWVFLSFMFSSVCATCGFYYGSFGHRFVSVSV